MAFTEPTSITEEPDIPIWKRLAWMIAIWAASVLALGVVSLLLRLWLKP